TLTPLKLAKESQKLAKSHRLKVSILNEKELKKRGCNLILAVGQGSVNKPRLIFLEYLRAGKNKKTIAFVGKGITFDSGGINLKPSGHLEDMRLDMSGAGAVLGAIKAIASLKLKVNVIGVLACAENAIGSNAYKPGEIFRAFNGKTVEVLNTDAEGRLVLADALSFTEKKYKPDYIIDLATLTGAALIALGDKYAGLMSEDNSLQELIIKSSEESDDPVWPLPLTEPFMKDMKSDIADLRNIGKNRNAGTIRGAVFLKEFIENAKWAHIDIAGTAWSSQKYGYVPKYATGYGVRLLTNICTKL
ncbi:hypothetical protein BVX93_01135, partial [bacterium B13(2017)]